MILYWDRQWVEEESRYAGSVVYLNSKYGFALLSLDSLLKIYAPEVE